MKKQTGLSLLIFSVNQCRLLLLLLMLGSVTSVQAQASTGANKTLHIVSDIYPIQQIAKAIAGQPVELLIDSQLSPHQYQLSPKQAEKIQSVDLLIWVGDNLTPNLRQLVSLREQQKRGSTLTLLRLPHLIRLAGDEHDEHDNHANEESDIHDEHLKHDQHVEKNHNEDAALSLNADTDPHIWLSLSNAQVIATAISDRLAILNPSESKKYQQNLQNFINQLQQMRNQITVLLKPIQDRPYYVFHDAYQYFEKDFQIKHQDVIKLSANHEIGTRHFLGLSDKVKQTGGCVFAEPQFDNAILTQFKKSGVRVATLDPVGHAADDANQASNQAVINGYLTLMANLAKQLNQCLTL